MGKAKARPAAPDPGPPGRDPGGRPTKLTDPVRDALCRDLALGVPRATACGRAGVSYSTFKAWVTRGRRGEAPYADFLAALQKAETEAVARNVGIVQKVANGGYVTETRTVTRADGTTEVLEKKAEPVWTAAAWFLERRYPGDFGSNRRELADLKAQVAELAALLAGVPRAHPGPPPPDPPAPPGDEGAAGPAAPAAGG